MARSKKNHEVNEVNELEILRIAMKERGVTQVMLADRLGVIQSSISGSLNRKRPTVEVFKRILNAMEYDVVILDRETGEIMWKVKPES